IDLLPSYGIGRTNPFFFSYASIPFEDERIKKDVWPEIKPLTPYGQLPMLVADRRKVAQSTAICRYLIVHICSEIAAFHYEEDEKVKAAKRKAAEETLLFILERLDQQVKENDGYFYDGTLSWADLTFVALLDYLNFMYKSDLIENYENLKLLEKKVLLLPKIKNWIERRPGNIEESKENEEIVGTMRGYSFFHNLFSLRLGGKTQMNVTVGFIYVSAICYYRMEEDPEKKEARKNQLLNETIPFYLTKFDQIIGENEGYIIPSIVR
ncbi:glutathione S-transferase-like, partial [Bombus huntii]|uniref:glutathione S-transferase-like n=1 Tax=Bombus huntii TaxID=85661 RepID=UPI0021A9F54E